MFNIGLEVIQAPVSKSWSLEQFYELDNELTGYYDAVINLCTISESLKKYGRTQQLKELVGPSIESAGLTFSQEGLWSGIKSFFKWIWDKLTAMWNWFKGLFGFNKKEEAQDKALLEKAGLEVKEAGTDKESIEIKDVSALVKMSQELAALEKSLPEVTSIEDPAAASAEQVEALIAKLEAVVKDSKVFDEEGRMIETTKGQALYAAADVLKVVQGLNVLLAKIGKRVEQTMNVVGDANKLIEQAERSGAKPELKLKKDKQPLRLKENVPTSAPDSTPAHLPPIAPQQLAQKAKEAKAQHKAQGLFSRGILAAKKGLKKGFNYMVHGTPVKYNRQ